MTFDVVLSDTAEAFLAEIGPVERRDFYRALDVLLQDPYPDGISKVSLPFFYRPGVIGFTYRKFWISYVIQNAATIGVASVYWAPDAPRRAGDLFEA